MHEEDKQTIIRRYADRIQLHGHGLHAIGEPKNRQALYFSGLLRAEGFKPGDSVLDVGCGYGDLHGFLKSNQWRGNYTGVDINPDLISEGKRRHHDLNLLVQDLQKEPPSVVHDWSVSFGVLTSKTEQVPYLQHLEEMLTLMWASCRKGMVFNLLSPLADYTHPVHARPDFGDVLKIVNKLTNRFAVYHDYMPYEYILCAYKENAINRELLVFSAFADFSMPVQVTNVTDGNGV